MKVAAIIPARYQSVRFEGKPLALIDGVTMIERVYRQVEKCPKFSDIIVATDDKRIADTVTEFGGYAVITSPAHGSGTERVWEVLEVSDFDAAINIQGDEPLISEKLIEEVFNLLETWEYPVVTPVYHNTSYEDYLSPHVVKAVVDFDYQALYFSRSPVPYSSKENFKGFYQHIGLYGYLKSTLNTFIKLPISKLESSEKLEQLRFLENGIVIKTVRSTYPSFGVDIPEDIQRIEAMLKLRQSTK